MNELPSALLGLSDYKQFIIWKPVPSGVKISKEPLDPKTGNVHDAHDPTIWCTAKEAIEHLITKRKYA